MPTDRPSGPPGGAAPALAPPRPGALAERLALALALGLGAGAPLLPALASAPPAALALWPAGAVIAYALLAALAGAEDLGATAAELGLLLALAAAALALHRLGAGPGLAPALGAALLPLLAGLALRLLLRPPAPDRALREALALAWRRADEAAEGAGRHAADRARRLEEITDAHARRTGELIDRQAELYEATARAFAHRLATELHDSLTEEADRAAAVLSDAAERLAASLHVLADARGIQDWDEEDAARGPGA